MTRRFVLLLIAAGLFFLCDFSASAQSQNSQPALDSFDALAQTAAAARESGKSAEALADYRRAVELRGDWVEGWWYIGTLLYDEDRYQDALPAFQKVTQLAPQLGPAWSFLGLCEYETKAFDSAREHLEKARTLESDDPETSRVANYHLALLLNKNGEFDRASQILASDFGQSHPSPQIALALGLSTLRVPLVPEEIDPSKEGLLRGAGEAVALKLQGKNDQAALGIAALLKDYPQVPYLHFVYGEALEAAGKHREALREFGTETKLSPQNAQVHQAFADRLQAAGDFAYAKKESEIAKQLAQKTLRPEERQIALYAKGAAHDKTTANSNPAQQKDTANSGDADFETFARRANTAFSENRPDEAIQNYRRAIELRPDWDEGRWNLAMLYYTMARYPEAAAELRSWVERKPKDGTAWAVLGLCEFETKSYDNALIHLERGATLGLGGDANAVASAKYHYALLLIRKGDFVRATDLLTTVADNGALAEQIHFALGLALLRMPLLPSAVDPSKAPLIQSTGEVAALLHESKYDAAFPKLARLAKNYPEQPYIHYAYGAAYSSLSQYDEAATQFREEIRISPKSELPYVELASIALRKRVPSDAVPFAQQAIHLAPDSAEAHYALGRAYLDLGQTVEAVSELETASKLAPRSAEVHFNLAKAYAKAKMPEKAERERQIFAQLNALAEQQRSLHGSQAYGAANNMYGTSSASQTAPASAPQ